MLRPVLTFCNRFTETDHPQRRTTLKDLVSVGRRMMYAIVVDLANDSFTICNSFNMGFEKYPDPVDPKEKELLHACNAILFPSV